MITFLTSNPFIEGTESLNPQNRFVEELLFNVKRNHVHAVFVCSDPDQHDFTDASAGSMRKGMEEAGIQFDSYNVLDGRTVGWARTYVDTSEVVILSGGHVPTQHRFFERIHLRELLQHFRGVVIGISAGSMNMAESVFSHPELPGETRNPHYRCEFPGLGLSMRNILPHWQNLQHMVLDGKRMLEDIIIPTTDEHAFYCLPDGSYIFSDGGKEELRGEAYLASNRIVRPICYTGSVLRLQVNY